MKALKTFYFVSCKILNILSNKHQDWFNMAKSFGLSDDDANEIVQEMYIRVHDYTRDIKKIMYNEKEVNTFYIYITLRNLYYSNFAKYGKSIKTKKIYLFTEMDENKFNKLFNNYYEDYELYTQGVNKKKNLDKLHDKIEKTIDSWYWYDKKLTKLYFNSGMSMRDLSKATKISLSSIFNTLTNAKEKIRESTKEEYRKYKS
jgi:DNA-directed RNA polymerase specialized sigma24 family protein|tara:strand:- start:449 stop:1054 length:606 start_codon:yes stop_codon:yes gene_type:complete